MEMSNSYILSASCTIRGGNKHGEGGKGRGGMNRREMGRKMLTDVYGGMYVDVGEGRG